MMISALLHLSRFMVARVSQAVVPVTLSAVCQQSEVELLRSGIPDHLVGIHRRSVSHRSVLEDLKISLWKTLTDFTS